MILGPTVLIIPSRVVLVPVCASMILGPTTFIIPSRVVLVPGSDVVSMILCP